MIEFPLVKDREKERNQSIQTVKHRHTLAGKCAGRASAFLFGSRSAVLSALMLAAATEHANMYPFPTHAQTDARTEWTFGTW